MAIQVAVGWIFGKGAPMAWSQRPPPPLLFVSAASFPLAEIPVELSALCAISPPSLYGGYFQRSTKVQRCK
eukprot:scaffold157943_cov28-Tisochrysis_lutea.AAC.2